MTDLTSSLLEQVQQARADGTPLQIIGGNSKAFMGRPPAGEPLSLSGHSGIVSYQPVELVLTARAGTSVAEVQATLAERGQMLACDPPLFDGRATLGGTLACHLSGPGRPWSGSIRDQLLGLRLINGRGEHLRFGGQVMKNVAGYDVSRLQAGAMGTLGVITELSLKVMPVPDCTLTLVRELDAAAALTEMNRLAGQPRPLTAACWLDNRLYLRLSGAASAVQGTTHVWPGEVLEDGDAFWRDLREQRLAYFDGNAPLWRFSVKSTAAHALPDAPWLLDWGGSQRWLRGEFDQPELEALAEAAGGQVALYRGGDRNGEVLHTLPAPMQALQRRLKAALDPDGLFNPGRLYGWL
ncbi:glycolate oxidase FAD binding subunit [Oceanimonas sp. GK1]|uniref:glycolate oxidase subunit GlcE n=1 Tax=Oceanimonas sp. (strain GK1 / IBRC-M 10197) TaxID=511062 RepID=UPI0002494A59|nr:glycolate oxidase subunit GlcE [Oceanimonas sp. GK1]AEY00169.1 glycolate oxidase FAD binding subunit [Oceanimonas sp. GK1]